MKKILTAMVAVCLVLSAHSGDANADIVISVGMEDAGAVVNNVNTTAGSAVSVGVYATSNDGTNLTGFDVPFDIGGDGVGNLPTGLTLEAFPNGASSGSPFGTPLFFTYAQDSAFEDVIANDFSLGAGTPLSTTPLLLFNLNFLVDAGVAGGTVFQLPVITGPTLTVNGELNPTASGNVLINNGTITVGVIPEPGSFVLLGVGVVSLLARRRRR